MEAIRNATPNVPAMSSNIGNLRCQLTRKRVPLTPELSAIEVMRIWLTNPRAKEF